MLQPKFFVVHSDSPGPWLKQALDLANLLGVCYWTAPMRPFSLEIPENQDEAQIARELLAGTQLKYHESTYNPCIY